MTDAPPAYEELQLRVRPAQRGAYRVEAVAADGSRAHGTFRLPVDETQLDNFVLQVGQPRRSVRKYRSPQMERAKDFGGRLFEALVAGDVRDLYRTARSSAEARGLGLRVTLYLTEAPTLMSVPWEFLFERPGFLAQSIYTPLVRSLDLKYVRQPHPVVLPLRILGIVSRPKGVTALDVDGEQQRLADALAPLSDAGLVTLEWLPRATLSDLHDVISRPGEIHVLHYIGHGAYDERTESGILLFEDEDGLRHEVTGEELGTLLQDEHSLRLVVLNSCEGARTSHVDPFSGVASSLVEVGIPAVIGMQFEITDEAAITFAGSLYKAVIEGYPVDAALAQVRKAIFAARHDVEFGTPVLFLRATDAHLFEFDLRSRPPDLPTPMTSPADQAETSAPDAARADAADEAGPPADDGGPSGKRRRRISRRAGTLIGAGVALAVLAVVAALVVYVGGDSDSVVFEDDFSSEASGWVATPLDAGRYQDGAYHLSAEPEVVASSTPEGASSVFPSAPPSVGIEVDARLILGGTEQAQYGILCRLRLNTWYAFVMKGDSASIWRHEDNKPETRLGGGTAQLDPAGTDELSASCEGDEDETAVHLQFSVNGTTVADETDTNPLPNGSVALFTDSRDTPQSPTTVQYDSFVVTES